MPPLTKAQKKLAQATEDAFHRTYAAQYGDERWHGSLYPALAAPTRYAALVNRFAAAGSDGGTEKGNGIFPPDQEQEAMTKLQVVAFPRSSTTTTATTTASSSEEEERKEAEDLGSSTSTNPTVTGLLAYQYAVSEIETETESSSTASTIKTTFPPPRPSPSTGLLTHWNLDAASLLAVSVLNPQPGDRVLDLCAAPGGKSVALAQLLFPSPSYSPSSSGSCLHVNEVHPTRNKRLTTNLHSYLPSPLFKSPHGTGSDTTAAVQILHLDGTSSSFPTTLPLGPGGYDKVLLDAPCSSERHIIHSKSNSRTKGGEEWRSGHSKKQAKTQTALLMTALRAIRIGGRVLYATCSISGEENDGVVERGLEGVKKERKKLGMGWDVVVRSGELEGNDDEEKEGGKEGEGGGSSRLVRDWAEKTKYGWLVLPDHEGGGRWGPLFFALLEKVAV